MLLPKSKETLSILGVRIEVLISPTAPTTCASSPLLSISHPPISPEVALTVPLMFAAEANKLPLGVTINGAAVGLLLPAQNATPSELGEIPTLVVLEPAIKLVDPIVKPPIVPLVAVMAPVIDKLDPFQVIRFPEGLPILKVPPFSFVKKNPFPVLKSVAFALRIVP